MSLHSYKALSDTYPAWAPDIEKIYNYLSVRSAGESFAPRDLADKLDISQKSARVIFSHLCAANVLQQKNIQLCPKPSCHENELTFIDDNTFECDLCDQTHEALAGNEKTVYELKSVPERTFNYQGGKMLKGFLNSQVDLVKKDGTIVNNIPASVQSNRIFIEDTSVAIEDGDMLINPLPNGVVDRFEVVDHGFKPAFSGFPAHYQVHVKKSGKLEKQNTVINHYNMGANSRVNHHSIDQSTNVLNMQQNKIFDQMKSLADENLEKIIADQVKTKIDELQSAKEKKGFLQTSKEILGLAGDSLEFVTKLLPLVTLAQENFK
jgi:hypothetical protein